MPREGIEPSWITPHDLLQALKTRCWEGESNSHGLLHTILSRARLPVPPPGHKLISPLGLIQLFFILSENNIIVKEW